MIVNMCAGMHRTFHALTEKGEYYENKQKCFPACLCSVCPQPQSDFLNGSGIGFPFSICSGRIRIG